jgi:K+-transporting ATPase, c chain
MLSPTVSVRRRSRLITNRSGFTSSLAQRSIDSRRHRRRLGGTCRASRLMCRYRLLRVPKARGVSAAQVASLVDKYKKGRDFGFLGEPRVNVPQLNIALDKTYPFHG